MEAIRQFHAGHPRIALQINVTRRPYSFLGDSKSESGKRHKLSTWHEGLLGYVGGDEARRDEAERGLQAQGREAGIAFDFNVRTHWQPIDSQRLLLWAGRFGKQEEFMTNLNRRHFERGSAGESASERATLLAAAAEVGLDVAAATAFLETDELVKEVWASYGDTIHGRGIHSIPLFVFNCPALNLIGGPFRAGPGTPFVINGSMNAPTFLAVFESALDRLVAAQRTAPLLGRRVLISGLSRDELNGREGLAQSFQEGSGRYAVALEGANGDLLALKPANLKPLDRLDDAPATCEPGAASARAAAPAASSAHTSPPELLGCRVGIHGLKGRPDLNGKVGSARSFDAAKARYAVRVEGEADAVLLRPSCLVNIELLAPLMMTAGTARHLKRQLEKAAVTAGVAEEDASSLIDSWQAAVVGSDTPEEEEGDDELAMF